MKKNILAELVLKDGTTYTGESFGAKKSISGEVVFATGMVGYPEILTDPSFRGQILVLTYPLIGNYGVPKKEFWESNKIQIAGLVVCNYTDTPSHHSMQMSLGEWLKIEKIPALKIKDIRALTQKLRDEGVMLGKIIAGHKDVSFKDPNLRNLVAEVSTKKIVSFVKNDFSIIEKQTNLKSLEKTVVILDCGVKRNIIRSILTRGFKVVLVPWNTDVLKLDFEFSAVVISNGPGDPKKVKTTINNVKKIISKKIPIFGICLGNQILALASYGTTYKLKFGHRSQNQPVIEYKTNKCYLTTQNHGYAIKKIPNGFKKWFYNANDKTNEGIFHENLPFMAVQFHPESSPGPTDTDWTFDYFFKKAKIYENKSKK